MSSPAGPPAVADRRAEPGPGLSQPAADFHLRPHAGGHEPTELRLPDQRHRPDAAPEAHGLLTRRHGALAAGQHVPDPARRLWVERRRSPGRDIGDLDHHGDVVPGAGCGVDGLGLGAALGQMNTSFILALLIIAAVF